MPNTYVNKVITGAGSTLIDLSQDTVTSASHIIGGRVGHLADGSSVSGTGSKTVTYSLSSGVSANVSPDSIITGEGLCLRLLAPSGYVLSNVSVTMDGVDITNSVFAFDTKEEPTLAAKSITANGTYTASSDNADGYSSVTVNVSGVSPTLTTKSITANGTYNASDDSADGYSSVTVNVSGGGGGTPIKTKTGTVTGGGTTTVTISCDFEPDLIYVYGDMSASANNRGIVSITIVKDTVIYVSNDSSTSNTNENGAYIAHGISGYGSTSNVHATYSNETLTLDTVTNSSAYRFRSGQTYNYKLIKWTS